MDYIEREAATRAVLIADCENVSLNDVIKVTEEAAEAIKRIPAADVISKHDVLAALERERERLLANGMDGAEHILVHHAINVIKDL